ncbi:hypothetical protein BAE44_0008613 [Dichanthelium oligosanthes]|uniref:Myb/SANT-like domain-containing protein n=1 Tax=Dichanthelium oligosanthes TaxID=888268 RepID=A0A1E5VZA3_9POAL|nr:hypothetical protein BAE44_0008613 [Dichanthelium oligosanthes]
MLHFCELCVEEIRPGNMNNGHMTNRGCLYAFWLLLHKETGLGRGSGTVVADDDWWKQNTKNHGEWRKLRYGPPENIAELEFMFQNIAADGSTSCIPGEQMREGYEGDEGGDGDKSTVRIHSLRRNSTSTTATCPRWRTKSPMVKVMKGV